LTNSVTVWFQAEISPNHKQDYDDGQPENDTTRLAEQVGQGADPEFLRDGLQLLAQELMEAEVTQLIP
jgi:hypothetical protein